MVKTRKTLNPSWTEYDRSVGRLHLMNFGMIFLDAFGCPIDNEYELDEAVDAYDAQINRKYSGGRL